MTLAKIGDRIHLASDRDAKQFKKHMERYRSGHNEAVLKTVCPQGRVGSNPTLSAVKKKVKKVLDKGKTTRYNVKAFDAKHNRRAIWRSTQAGRRGSPGKGVGR